jgi:hypothetical protein
VVLPTILATVTPHPFVNATITPANVTLGPVIGNITATPTATAGNVTERVGDSNSLAITAIIIVALLLIGLIAWNQWRKKK